MKRMTSWVVVCVLAVSYGERATVKGNEVTYEEYESMGFPCGTPVKSNGSFQFGSYAWVKYIVATTGVIDLCGQVATATNATIAGVPGSSALSGAHLLYSEVSREIPVSQYNITYTTLGIHQWSTAIPFYVIIGSSASQAYVAEPSPFVDEYYCQIAGGTWTGARAISPTVPSWSTLLAMDTTLRTWSEV